MAFRMVSGCGRMASSSNGLVGDEGIHGTDATDRGVEEVEELVGDARGDLSAVAPTEHVFMGHDHAAGLANTGGDGFPVVRTEGAQVDDLDIDA